MKKFHFGVTVIFLCIIYSACTKRNYDKLHPPSPVILPGVTCDTSGTRSYSLDIAPALSTNCNIPACHSTASPGGGYDLSNYNGVFNSASAGKLLSCVVWDGNASQMPSGSSNRISACDIAKIRNWVSNGAPNN